MVKKKSIDAIERDGGLLCLDLVTRWLTAGKIPCRMILPVFRT